MSKLYEPVLFGVAKRGLPCFSRVMTYFNNYNLDNDGITLEFKNSCQYFLALESDCWDIFEDHPNSYLYNVIRSQMSLRKVITKDSIACRLATRGYLTEEEIEKDRIATLILIHHLL